MMDRAATLLGTEVTITQEGKKAMGKIGAVVRYDNVKFNEGIRLRNADGSVETNFLNFESQQVYNGQEQGRYVFQKGKEYACYFFCGRRASDQPDNGEDFLSTDRWMIIVEKDI
jgi:hypothetical protein